MIIDIKFDAGKLKKTFHNIEKAHKVAAKNTLNIMAFVSRKNANKIIESEFTLRSNYTKRSIRVEKAEENSAELQSKIGSTAKYMEIQNEGGVKKTAAIGLQSIRGGGNMNRLISKQYYLQRIKKQMIQGKGRRGSSKSRFVARLYMAEKLGKFVRSGNKILRVNSFSSQKGRVNARTSIAYIIGTNVRVKATKWLDRSIEKPIQDAGNIYQRELKKQWKNID